VESGAVLEWCRVVLEDAVTEKADLTVLLVVVDRVNSGLASNLGGVEVV
jgi:hypothetical protein